MDFTDAVIFAGAIVAIVGAGIILGVTIGRSGRKTPAPPNPEKALLYGQLLVTLDGLRNADAPHKRRFIELYYRSLVHGSDSVVRALNSYLQSTTAPDDRYDSSTTAAARDQVALALRQDLQAQFEQLTQLEPQELYSIEISPGVPAVKPDAPVDAPYPAPASVAQSQSVPESGPPEPRPAPRGY